jgi:hypothetical protein
VGCPAAAGEQTRPAPVPAGPASWWGQVSWAACSTARCTARSREADVEPSRTTARKASRSAYATAQVVVQDLHSIHKVDMCKVGLPPQRQGTCVQAVHILHRLPLQLRQPATSGVKHPTCSPTSCLPCNSPTCYCCHSRQVHVAWAMARAWASGAASCRPLLLLLLLRGALWRGKQWRCLGGGPQGCWGRRRAAAPPAAASWLHAAGC